MAIRGRRSNVVERVYDDVPYVEGEKREAPTPYGWDHIQWVPEVLHPLAEKLWCELRVLPHAVDWVEEWTKAEHVVLLMHKFYQNKPAAGLSSEMRSILRDLGHTEDDRSAQRIVYRPVGGRRSSVGVDAEVGSSAVVEEKSVEVARPVASMASWRKRVG